MYNLAYLIYAITLGVDFMFEILKNENGLNVIYIKTKNGSVNAKMIRTVEGYVVLKGSKIRESDTKSTPSWAKKKRKQLISEGTIKNGVFLRNELFSSSSGASDVVTGNSTSGKKMWKTETGITSKFANKNF